MTTQFYLATPQSKATAGVLVLHAWWGLNPFFKDFCDRLAEEGFVALAPDLYHGAVAATIDEAKRLRSKAKRDMLEKEIPQALKQLRAQSGVNKVGVVGFSMGAHWALRLVEQKSSSIAATVLFYGARGGKYAGTKSAFLGHFAENDDWVAESGVKKLQKTLTAAGKEAAFHVYPGTTHWFFERDRAEAYNAKAAKLAWERTIEFLRAHLS